MKYSDSLKARMIQRMCGPDSISANRLAQEVDIPQTTLSRWLQNASAQKNVKRNGRVKDSGAVRPDDLPPLEKLRLVMEASTLSEEQLGEFLRRNGIHVAQLEEWRQAALSALEKPKKNRRRKSPEEKEVERLERELDRKDKALAEVTALLVLKKKLETLMGGEDESTKRGNER